MLHPIKAAKNPLYFKYTSLKIIKIIKIMLVLLKYEMISLIIIWLYIILKYSKFYLKSTSILIQPESHF